MRCPPTLENESERLLAMGEYGLDDEQPLPNLDPVVRIAARMFDAPVAVVNFIGSDHVFFLASAGIGAVDMRRDVSFCAHAIAENAVMVVPDARMDERFHDNPLVGGEKGICFYAGVPLRSPRGLALGTLCVIDHQPRHSFSDDDAERLSELARMASDRLELRRIEIAGARMEAEVELAAGPNPQARAAEEDELHRLANFDMLTGLPNRSHFYRSVEAAILGEKPYAVLMIDIDGFKDVNSTLGTRAGDDILRILANRLVNAVGADGTVARIGGDEFAVLLANSGGYDGPLRLAQSLILEMAEPLLLCGQEVRVEASCGVAYAPDHAQEAIELIGNADLALHQAKSMGSDRPVVFSPAFRTQAAERRVYSMELHRAVANGEFLLFYQPQISLSDNTLVGAEALLRWLHPTRGLLSPAAFLPALEAGPLAVTVGRWVIDQACAQAAVWWRQGLQPFRIAVNVFDAQFRNGDLLCDVSKALCRHGLPADALELEITENTALDRDDVVLGTLLALREKGVAVAFDDFGTGYASLSLLTRYPLTRIKIDRAFVQKMLQSRQEASVIDAILDIARAIGLETTAEGIETEEQRDYLRQRNCPEGQGYLFGKPMPAPAFASLLGDGGRPSARMVM